jgi:hypothetical protein
MLKEGPPTFVRRAVGAKPVKGRGISVWRLEYRTSSLGRAYDALSCRMNEGES